MLPQATIAERFAYGRSTASDQTTIQAASRPTAALIGRILMGIIFLLSGLSKLTNTEGVAAYLTQAGLPEAHTLTLIAGCAEVLGALSLFLGMLTRVGAGGLFVYLIPTTLVFHAFWKLTGEAQALQIANFLKNLAIMGGLATIVAFGPGRYSIDARLRRPKQP
jgi:putative oxidoreductase